MLSHIVSVVAPLLRRAQSSTSLLWSVGAGSSAVHAQGASHTSVNRPSRRTSVALAGSNGCRRNAAKKRRGSHSARLHTINGATDSWSSLPKPPASHAPNPLRPKAALASPGRPISSASDAAAVRARAEKPSPLAFDCMTVYSLFVAIHVADAKAQCRKDRAWKRLHRRLFCFCASLRRCDPASAAASFRAQATATAPTATRRPAARSL